MARLNPNQYPENYFDYYGTSAYKGDYYPYHDDGKTSKLTYFQNVMEYGTFSSVSDGFDPYCTERYDREIGYAQGRYNHGQNSLAQYKEVAKMRPLPEPKRDWALILSVIICIIVLALTCVVVVDKHFDGNPALGKSAEVTETTNTSAKK